MDQGHDLLKDIGSSSDTMVRATEMLNQLTDSITEAANVLNENLIRLKEHTLTGKEICKALNITEPTLIRRRKAGKVPFIQIGKNFYYLKPKGVDHA